MRRCFPVTHSCDIDYILLNFDFIVFVLHVPLCKRNPIIKSNMTLGVTSIKWHPPAPEIGHRKLSETSECRLTFSVMSEKEKNNKCKKTFLAKSRRKRSALYVTCNMSRQHQMQQKKISFIGEHVY